jgi:hypothetical protein
VSYVRLNKLRIIKNRDLLGKGEIQLMRFINHSNDSFLNIDVFFDRLDYSIFGYPNYAIEGINAQK